jgi:3-oxoacyl-[acyl-carrier protein] reductase
MGALDGKVAIVTGAAFGNGRGIAERFAAEGADVVVADVDTTRSEETARLVAARGCAALVQRCDVSRKADVDALIAAAVERFRPRRRRRRNAGIVETDTDCLRMTAEQWQRTIDVNLTGVFFTLQAACQPDDRPGHRRPADRHGEHHGRVGRRRDARLHRQQGRREAGGEELRDGLRPHGITCNAIAPV